MKNKVEHHVLRPMNKKMLPPPHIDHQNVEPGSRHYAKEEV